MTSERWHRVEQLYHAALGRDASQRAAFLDGACAGDESLRQEVESLLAREHSAEGFPAAPAFEAAATVMGEDAAPRAVLHPLGAPLSAIPHAAHGSTVYRDPARNGFTRREPGKAVVKTRPVGVLFGVITEGDAVADGGYDIVLQAVAKFRITREETGKPYRIARVTAIPETLRAAEGSALRTERRKLEMLVAASSAGIGIVPVPGGRSDEAFVNAVSQHLEIDLLKETTP
jgi:nitroreductase